MGLMMCRYAPCYTVVLPLTTANGGTADTTAACCDQCSLIASGGTMPQCGPLNDCL